MLQTICQAAIICESNGLEGENEPKNHDAIVSNDE